MSDLMRNDIKEVMSSFVSENPDKRPAKAKKIIEVILKSYNDNRELDIEHKLFSDEIIIILGKRE